MTWLVPSGQLTLDQQRAVQMDMSRHRVIFGPPGSGKTVVLLHRARHLCDIAETPLTGFRIFVYTRVLKAYIRDALEFLRLPEQCVMTFDQWCVGYYREYLGHGLPQQPIGSELDFPGIRQSVLDHLRRFGFRNQFRFVLVDEAQDLDDKAFEILKRISRHITVCADDRQQLYDSSTGQIEILRALGLHQQNLTLLGAYRCAPYVARLAAQLIDDSRERSQFLDAVQTDTARQETPLLYKAADLTDEKHHVLDILRDRAGRERIALLVPNKHLLIDFVNFVKQSGMAIESAGKTDGGMQMPENFEDFTPKALTYWSAKGLTFDTVLLPSLTTNSFPNQITEARLKKLLFVGITRATNWVYLGTQLRNELSVLSLFAPLETVGALKVTTHLATPHAQPPTVSPANHDLTSIL